MDRSPPETSLPASTFLASERRDVRAAKEMYAMLRGGLLWLIGIPLPIIIVLYLIGWL